eukprot:CAMPEP_0183738612 /NCGR_PEP_ID=MMETSP0737-20130205/55031_1 /TAXON_ID=385413 /ORGANISM="Thalassiosira miniscula, Strain CCMP1093" /LENGTH=77 /DNA_ID=CAMNT_0025973183 /DNA_START=309 /DNA_END=539 /DNA_ORIENTATION=-
MSVATNEIQAWKNFAALKSQPRKFDPPQLRRTHQRGRGADLDADGIIERRQSVLRHTLDPSILEKAMNEIDDDDEEN